MCSVVGCDSWRRKTHRFKLPEDPERRLEWVQFLFEVNGQRLKESSWTDITICNEHFTSDCFELLTPTGTVQLKSSAVPSLCVKSEPDQPEPCQLTPVTSMHWVQLKHDSVPSPCVKSEPDEHLESLQHVEPLEDVAYSPTSSEKSRHTLTVYQPVSNSPAASKALISGSDQMQRKITNIVLNKETAALLQMKGRHVVNERCLFQLFRRKCPSCGSKLQNEKVTCGVLLILNQQCLQCEYRNQWKSQVNASIPAAEEQQLTEVEGGSPVTKQEMSTDDNPSSAFFSEIVTFSDEESDASDEGEEGNDVGVSSDGEWNPTEDIMLAEELANQSEEDPEEEEDLDSPVGLKINELCTECGSFFTITKPHTCEHKIKPFSCNVCGKRCVTEVSLKNHSRIHNETYNHPCKYCHVAFKTRVDKLKHEQIHQDNKDPYKCPDCPETFSTNRKRSIHLQANHRTTKEHKCRVCGIAFKDVHHLQRHSVVHTGLKPYKCTVCQRDFNQGSHLKSHMRLHTGERPFQCQHCGKSFNHNVSLKSHVQRYHSSSSGHEGKKDKMDEKASDTEHRGNKRGTDSEFDNIEEEQDREEEKKQRKNVKKSRKKSTGRPRGRPKRNAADSSVLAGQKKGKCPNAQTAKSKMKKRGSNDEEREEEQSDSDLAQEEEEEETKEVTSMQRSRQRPKNDSDTDFDPEEETKKKRYSSQRSSTSSRKGMGRSK